MPSPAKPKTREPSPHGVVLTAGKQEDFHRPAIELAAKLGWAGEPAWVTNEITVLDAVGFFVKTMHEHHIAGAAGAPQPSLDPVFTHLAITDDAEKSLIVSALGAVFLASDGSPVTEHPITLSTATANLVLPVSAAGELLRNQVEAAKAAKVS